MIPWPHGLRANPLVHDLFGGLGLAMVVAVGAEYLWRRRTGRGYDLSGAAVSVGVGLGNLASGALTALALTFVYGAAWRLAPVHWPLSDWRTWTLGFVAVEFAYYWFHRWSHEVRWLWATHAVHHSAEEMTLLSAIRLGWTSLISCGWLCYLPLVLLGFDPRLITGLLALDLHYQFFLHTEAAGRLGPLEWVLNTPSHHRVHHGRNPSYLDRNYGGMVIVFDRLFGTFAAERPEEPVSYGLVHRETAPNPARAALGEWRRLLGDLRAAQGPRALIRTALGRPA